MGVGTGDLDGDGRPDLFVGGSNRLFLNQGGGRFAESTAGPGPWPVFGDEDDPAGVAEGDVNGDGRPDVVIGEHYNSTLDCRQAGADPAVPERDRRARAGCVLRDVTDAAGLVGLPTKSPHVEIADLDADGWPDIVTTAAGEDGQPDRVPQPRPRRRRRPRSSRPRRPGPKQYWVTGAVIDFDHDGRLDLVSAEWEPTLPTRFWRNAGEVGHWLDGRRRRTARTVDVARASRRVGRRRRARDRDGRRVDGLLGWPVRPGAVRASAPSTRWTCRSRDPARGPST